MWNRRVFPVIATFSLFLLPFSLYSADWPQFLGPERNGISSETGLVQGWPKEGPPRLWEKKVGEGYSGPVVVGDRLILFHRVDGNEVIECLAAASGKELWKTAYRSNYEDAYGKGDGSRSTPLLAGMHVYTLGADGDLHCLELDNGKVVWKRALNADYQVRKGFFGVATSPLLEGDLLLINVGGKAGAGIVALDRNTGKEVWKATDHEASYSSPVAVTIDGIRHVLFFTREGFVALDPKTGAIRHTLRWRARINASVNAATPLVAGDLVFLSSSYQTGAIVLRLRKDGLDEVWKNDESLSNHYNTSVHKDGFLYGFDGRQEEGARLRCVELKTGKVRWSQEGFGCGTLVLADGNLIVLNENGDLVLVEATPTAYREKARAALLAKPCRAQIALANGKLYARDNHKLACWNLKK